VHKISIYINREKKKEKEKEKRFPKQAGPGGISAQLSAGARGLVGRRPTRPASGETVQGRHRGHGPTCQREGELR
jgi:hypothetical protein